MAATMNKKLSSRKLSLLNDDPRRTAEAVQLVYVRDSQPGISRIKAATGFRYTWKGKPLSAAQLDRIKKLVIPPAWSGVWICNDPKGHLQATGYDTKGRKQYLYHPDWNTLRNMTKFAHLYEFGTALPVIRKKLNEDLKQTAFTASKVLALIVSVMEQTSIRIGNASYEKLYGSYGLTTLRNRHVVFDDNQVRFSFTGKKSVKQHITLTNKRLVRIMHQCHDIPGKELFQYYDDNNNRCSVDSGMVNDYIRGISGGHFTAKDFRTWAGSLHALRAFSELEPPVHNNDAHRNIVQVLDQVAAALGNTRSVCKKYYVHPLLPELYAGKGFPDPATWAELPGADELSGAEKALMHILKNTTIELSA